MFFPYLMSKWTYFKYFEIFKMAAMVQVRYWTGIVSEFELYTKVDYAILYILRFCSTF